MKAAVLHQTGRAPVFEDFPDPVVQPDEQLLFVKAASIKNLDRMRAEGTHYDRYTEFPVIVGVDGVGILENGSRVYTGSQKGMMAEKAIASRHWMVAVPDGLDDVTAAALPNPAISAWLSLESKGPLKKEDTVLIIGATGVTGRLAIQLAKYLGAGKVIAMGRNPKILDRLPGLGADVVISLRQSPEQVKEAVRAQMSQLPLTLVLDYCWGEPAELVLDALTGHDLGAESPLTRFIQIGEMAGPTIRLQASTLRSKAIELSGSGGGSISKEQLMKIPTVLIPEVFRLATEGKLQIDTETVPLRDVEMAWKHKHSTGKRMVVVI